MTVDFRRRREEALVFEHCAKTRINFHLLFASRHLVKQRIRLYDAHSLILRLLRLHLLLAFPLFVHNEQLKCARTKQKSARLYPEIIFGIKKPIKSRLNAHND